MSSLSDQSSPAQPVSDAERANRPTVVDWRMRAANAAADERVRRQRLAESRDGERAVERVTYRHQLALDLIRATSRILDLAIDDIPTVQFVLADDLATIAFGSTVVGIGTQIDQLCLYRQCPRGCGWWDRSVDCLTLADVGEVLHAWRSYWSSPDDHDCVYAPTAKPFPYRAGAYCGGIVAAFRDSSRLIYRALIGRSS